MPTTLLSLEDNKKRLNYPHFPAEFLGVIWRCWGQVSAEKLADVLETTPENIKKSAADLGLDPNAKVIDVFRKRGYITLIRNAWHLMTFDQIARLLDITDFELDTILKEDDFLYHKLGRIMPVGEKTVWRELTAEEQKEVEFVKETISLYQPLLEENPDNAFEFINKYYEKADDVPHFVSDINGNMRFIYSYFAPYGDPLIEDDCDPFPDKLLEEYAEYGINGIWMQGVLYQLTPYPFCPELSKGWEKRLANLAKIVKKAAKYGIGIYLYLNEPRYMPKSVFEKYPHLKGHIVNPKLEMYSMCTSTPEVQEYLENAIYQLFKGAEGLAGMFTITVSENQTNCYSHAIKMECNCPRCKDRKAYEVISEVNNIMSRGALRANPKARVIAWDWSWPAAQIEDIIARLDKNIIVQSTSEHDIRLFRGGVRSRVDDYVMSVPGPGEHAKEIWNIAKKHGLERSAKCQFNCTWELPNVPYIPVYDLVAEYANNLKVLNIEHIMLSWTLGGSPSPNIRLLCDILEGKCENVREFVGKRYPDDMTEVVMSAEQVFSGAFRQFPFSIGVAYSAPQSSGPKSPFFVEPTGWKATMTGLPYDDIQKWCGSVFPPEVYEKQFALVVSGWRVALDIMESYKGETNEAFYELYDCMLGSYIHYLTNLNLARFVMRRNAALENGFTNEDIDYLINILDIEEKNVVDAIKLQSRDSRFGFEAANHYCFTHQDMTEKLINIAWCKRYYEEMRGKING